MMLMSILCQKWVFVDSLTGIFLPKLEKEFAELMWKRRKGDLAEERDHCYPVHVDRILSQPHYPVLVGPLFVLLAVTIQASSPDPL